MLPILHHQIQNRSQVQAEVLLLVHHRRVFLPADPEET